MKPGVKLDLASLRQTLEARTKGAEPKLGEILERVGARVVELLRGYTGEKNRRGRPMHPGGWADKTFSLREGFYHKVRREGGGVVLEIGNDARHAHLVEALDGIFVVRGIAEPGGPVEAALRQAVQELAPEWVVKS